ncbi:MAG: TIM barrel protein [Vicinamibacteria bacterium]|jgi:inosose dehydratase|nr:TIM barrel protein [Vicinamibacteria bacterium]
MPQPRVGNAPVSWAVYEAHLPNPPFATVLDAIAAAGYEGTELGPYGYLPTAPEDLAKELDSRRLTLGSSFVPVALEDEAAREAVIAHALKVSGLLARFGVKELIVADDEDPRRAAHAGRIPKDGSMGWSAAQWKTAIATLETVARRVKDEHGLSVVVHHHAGTFIETSEEIDRLLEGARPELVNLLLDTGHAAYGGGDPVDIATRHGARVKYVHLKDADATQLAHVRASDIGMSEAWKRGIFCALGQGVVDFKGVYAALARHGYDGWLIVEQDVVPDASGRLQPDPTESARASRKYLQEVLGL